MNEKKASPGSKNKEINSPRWIKILLTRITASHLREEVLGDVDELFQKRSQRYGSRKASFLSIIDVLFLIHPRLWRRKPAPYVAPSYLTTHENHSAFLLRNSMIRNYFKIAFRNLAKNRVYSFINILGLSTGMAVAMLIGLWIYDEFSANRHHKNYENLYRVELSQTFDGVRSTGEGVPLPLAQELKTQYPDFKAVANYEWGGDHSLTFQERKFTKRGRFVGHEAIDMFSLPVLAGDKDPLRELHSIVLTDETAEAVFGKEDPVGKIVKLDNKTDLKITAVVAKQPQNATLQFDFLLPWDLQMTMYDGMENYMTQWGNNSWGIFVQLKAGVKPEETSAKIKNVVIKHFTDDNTLKGIKPEVIIHPMKKWRLYSEFSGGANTGGFIKYVRLFGIFGLFILVIACINFMNLSTARSEKRSKEVGVRKAVGSGRSQLVAQFLSESVLIAFIGMVLATGMVIFSLPYFNTLTEKKMSLQMSNPVFWGVMLFFVLFTGLLAGSYPALYLSSFNPVKILKGGAQMGKGAALPRKVLVVIQFVFSIVLIIGTIVIYQQIQYGKNRPIGLNNKGLISVNSSESLLANFEPLRNELLESGTVLSICKINSPPTDIWASQNGWEWSGSTPNDKATAFKTIATEHDYIKTMGITLKEGRDFSREYATDSTGIILNEAAVQRMGFKEPIGQLVKWNGVERKVVGVIPDLMLESPFQSASPLVVVFFRNWVNCISIRINPKVSASEAIRKITPVFDKYNPGYTFDYRFADSEYARKFNYEELIGNFSAIVALLGIFISCLGLFGLASFMAEQRTKEIGIRKVLGASVSNLWLLLSKDFVALVVIAFVISAPAAYYFLDNWLQNYQYRTGLSWWIFAVSGTGALVITLLTVSFQCIKAALLDPVKSLKSE